MRSEVLTLERRQVDLRTGTVQLDPGSTKNSEGRVVYLTPELKTLLAHQLDRSVAMKITGHKTESVYRRYAIVNDADLQEAVRRLTGITAGITARPDVAPGS